MFENPVIAYNMIDKSQRKVYRLCSLREWEMSRFTGFLPYNQDDTRDGYFHLSLDHQVQKTAQKYYANIEDLQLLCLLIGDLGELLRVEANADGELFPHAYGPVPRAAVIFAKPVPITDGAYVFPKELFG